MRNRLIVSDNTRTILRQGRAESSDLLMNSIIVRSVRNFFIILLNRCLVSTEIVISVASGFSELLDIP